MNEHKYCHQVYVPFNPDKQEELYMFGVARLFESVRITCEKLGETYKQLQIRTFDDFKFPHQVCMQIEWEGYKDA